MPAFSQIIKMVAVLAAAALIGNWFLHELRRARRDRKPLYSAYLTPPGILIILSALLLPLIVWYLGRS